MKREIRFRAWDGSKMIYNVAVIGGIAMVEKNPAHSSQVVDSDGVSHYSDWAQYKPIKDAVLMQFTGLRDKNGNEIYEGDIASMRSIYEPIDSEYIDRDGFDITYTGRVVITAAGGTQIRNAKITDNYGNASDFCSKNYKTVAAYRTTIIGNIHANPELLNK